MIFATIDTSMQDISLIDKIVTRATGNSFTRDRLSMLMDLEVAHHSCHLDLEALLNAPDLDFWHDINGIAAHLNRETGELEDCFSPRYALR